MTVVVDSNIIFSCLLSKYSHFAKQLFKPENVYVTVNYLVYEIFNHKERILKHSKLNSEEQKEHFTLIFSRIRLIPESEISFRSYFLAHKIVSSTDMDDIAFVALAFELNAKLWTNDEPVKEAIRRYGGIELFHPE